MPWHKVEVPDNPTTEELINTIPEDRRDLLRMLGTTEYCLFSNCRYQDCTFFSSDDANTSTYLRYIMKSWWRGLSVWALKGAPSPCILAKVGAGRYRIAGSVDLPKEFGEWKLMNDDGKIWELGTGYDDWSHLPAKLERITLE